MTKVYNKALQKTITVHRIIGKIQGAVKGPTLVFFAGIHGNETAGVFALKQVLDTLSKTTIKGVVYGIAGNLSALQANQRYIDDDLNRLWTKTQLKELQNKTNLNSEETEQVNLFKTINEIIDSNSGPFYFIDFHTTSSKTLPFITINDALINRKFSKLFPVPIVLGIEEYLNGPLLSHINERGYVSLGFESGQHNEAEAISNCIAFIHLALVYSNALERNAIVDFLVFYKQLKTRSKALDKIFEVVYLYAIKANEEFKMKPNFESFQTISKGTVLATSNNKGVSSRYNAKLFMPLYQTKGKEGFFIIKTIKPFFLNLSEILRKLQVDQLIVLFPGISWETKQKHTLLVNLKIARFLVKPFFHLLGYRSKQISYSHLKLYNRERYANVKMYKNEEWYR